MAGAAEKGLQPRPNGTASGSLQRSRGDGQAPRRSRSAAECQRQQRPGASTGRAREGPGSGVLRTPVVMLSRLHV